jgi:hypothetical protein
LALTPQSNEAFLREVDDAVRQDQLAGFWRNYGRWVAGLVVLGLALFAGWLYWNHHSAAKSGEVAEEMQGLLQVVAAGGTPDMQKLDALTSASQPGYRASALMAKAAVAMKKNDTKGAIAIFKGMAADDSLAKPYRDLGLIRQTALEFDSLKPEEIIARMKPFAAAGDPWFGSAGEMTAIAYMKMRKPDLAGPLFAALAKDAQVPESVRSRARQMAGLLGVDAIDATVGIGEDGGANATSGG